jgi:hypothetical protein
MRGIYGAVVDPHIFRFTAGIQGDGRGISEIISGGLRRLKKIEKSKRHYDL